MKTHDIGYYSDGLHQIPFCKICGKEELELITEECVDFDEKKVDKVEKKD